MQAYVNLDALIRREDFEVKSDQEGQPSQLTATIKISDLEPQSLTYQTLRKPDFQRETANWESQKIADFVLSFLDGDLIPSIILWRSPLTGNVFVIDGAHRLSALIAWVHDDYGDNSISLPFFSNWIPPEQGKAADKTRKLIKQTIGSYQEIKNAALNPTTTSPQKLKHARNLSAFAVNLQWVVGDGNKAEASFFKINQKATPIDPTELQMIESRRKPNALAARALIRAGVGHKYWSVLPEHAQRELEGIAREIYEVLFIPPLETPIKTLDLPVAGRGYSAESVRLLFDLVNLANDGFRRQTKPKPLGDDLDGKATVEFLKRVRRIAYRISGDSPCSLGLHPAVYFYGATGRYQPTAFLATASLIKELEASDQFEYFIRNRSKFEDFLLAYRYFINQTVSKFGSGVRGHDWVLKLYRKILRMIDESKEDRDIVAALQSDDEFGFLKEIGAQDKWARASFSTETKSAAFLREAITKALRCKICNARIHRKSISVDHIYRKQDGGVGDLENAQLTHPYCNTGYKEKLHAQLVPRNTNPT